MTARTETNRNSHEDAIALEWLKYSERQIKRGDKIATLTNSFDAIVTEWEESGKLRANHRKLSLDAAKRTALEFLTSGFFPTVKDELGKMSREHKALDAKRDAMLKKAAQMRKNAYVNRATNDRNLKVARMMIGRADALEVKARHITA